MSKHYILSTSTITLVIAKKAFNSIDIKTNLDLLDIFSVNAPWGYFILVAGHTGGVTHVSTLGLYKS